VGPFAANSQSELWIGFGHVNWPNSHWKGRIGDVRFYRAALATNELATAHEWLGDLDADGLINGREYLLGTDPNDADTDGDGLSDGDEVLAHLTDPLDDDTDGDGMPDGWEIANGFDPLDDADAAEDADVDGLTNLLEYSNGTDPNDADTDGDGLSDGVEVLTHLTDPLDTDTDGDGMPDGWEIASGFDPLDDADAAEDADGDGLANGLEYSNGTNPNDADTDGDGLSDGAEVLTHSTDPLDVDTDDDGMPDGWEVGYGLDPLDPLDAGGDLDDDGLTNLEEYPLGTNPTLDDTDGDGLDDGDEVNVRGTDPLNVDTDGDEMTDGWEVDHAFNPLSGLAPEYGLRVWLRLDEGEGTALSNSAAADFSGVLENPGSAQWTNGILGEALWLDGAQGYAAIDQSAQAAITGGAFTASAWVWYDPAATSEFPTVVSDMLWPSEGNPQGFELRVDAVENRIVGIVGHSAHGATEVSASLWDERWGGRWVHVALSHGEGTSRLYVDGSLWSEAPADFEPAASDELWVGRGSATNAGSAWRGRLDDVRLYSTALTAGQLHELFEGWSDANGDGVSNVDSWRADLDPRANPAPATTQGSLDVEFVPLDWTATEEPQYLAHFDAATPGGEIHLYVEDDALTFLMIDAEGQRHEIRHRSLVEGGYVMPMATNRVTASWRGYNTGRPTLEMRLFVNGIDYQADLGYVGNPRLTSPTWDQGTDYSFAAFAEADWNVPVASAGIAFGAWADGVLTAKIAAVSTTLHASAYGMISTNPLPPFAVGTRTPPPPGDRPRTLLQTMTRPRDAESFVSSNEVRVLARRYAQAADSTELVMQWMGWAYESVTNDWPFFEDHVKTVIEVGNQEGLDIALSSWIYLDAMVYYRYSNSIPGRAEQFHVETNGTQARIVLTNSHWAVNDYWRTPRFDVADTNTTADFLLQWRTYLSQFSGYSYFFFNEDALQPKWDSAYLRSPTASESGLAWFREYVAGQYGPEYADIRFPASPLAMGALDATNASSYEVVLDDSVTNRLEITTDPAHWAKWWEWRQVVFANLMAGYARHLDELNETNDNWRGTAYFVSPLSAWSPRTAVNLPLVAQIPELDWLIMENTRFGSYGTSSARMEEEVLLQLEAMKAVTSTNVGFGSYVMAHRYLYPTVTNGVTNATYTLPWIESDVEYAASDEFQSELVVPYSASMLVNRPGYTSSFQNVHYVPEVANAWNAARFGKLWSSLSGHGVSGNAASTTSIRFAWASLEKAQGYEWQLSGSSAFAWTNVEASTATTNVFWSLLDDPAPIGDPLHWRVRGVFHVYDFEENGSVSGTNLFYGAWAEAPAPLEVVDTDGDAMPDAWKTHYFGDLSQTAAGDYNANGKPNLQEYLDGTDPVAP
jgi:hypothetical protein